MSVKSQETNMRRLADLLSRDLGYIWGENERGPNGAKKTFLNLGKVFLRALSKDLGLRDAKVTAEFISSFPSRAVAGSVCFCTARFGTPGTTLAGTTIS